MRRCELWPGFISFFGGSCFDLTVQAHAQTRQRCEESQISFEPANEEDEKYHMSEITGVKGCVYRFKRRIAVPVILVQDPSRCIKEPDKSHDTPDAKWDDDTQRPIVIIAADDERIRTRAITAEGALAGHKEVAR